MSMPGNGPPVAVLTGSGMRLDLEFLGFAATT
jgi:hypothetical protein